MSEVGSTLVLGRLVEATLLKAAVATHYAKRGYTSDLAILGLGLCEEAGEVAASILSSSKIFVSREGRPVHDLERELYDCLVYLAAIANSANIDFPVYVDKAVVDRMFCTRDEV